MLLKPNGKAFSSLCRNPIVQLSTVAFPKLLLAARACIVLEEVRAVLAAEALSYDWKKPGRVLPTLQLHPTARLGIVGMIAAFKLCSS